MSKIVNFIFVTKRWYKPDIAFLLANLTLFCSASLHQPVMMDDWKRWNGKNLKARIPDSCSGTGPASIWQVKPSDKKFDSVIFSSSLCLTSASCFSRSTRSSTSSSFMVELNEGLTMEMSTRLPSRCTSLINWGKTSVYDRKSEPMIFIYFNIHIHVSKFNTKRKETLVLNIWHHNNIIQHWGKNHYNKKGIY